MAFIATFLILIGLALIYVGSRERYYFAAFTQYGGTTLISGGLLLVGLGGWLIGLWLLNSIPGGPILLDWLDRQYILCRDFLDHVPGAGYVLDVVFVAIFVVVVSVLHWYLHPRVAAPSDKHLHEAVVSTTPNQTLAQLESCISLDPGNAEAISLRGDIYKARKQYQKAVDDYTKLLSMRTPFVKSLSSLHYDRGYCLAKLGKTEQALDDFTKAISISMNMKYYLMTKPTCAELYRARAEIYERLGKVDLAKEDWKKAFEMRSKDS